MAIKPHGSVPDPVPLDLSAPSQAHVDPLARALAEMDLEALGLDPATLVTGEPPAEPAEPVEPEPSTVDVPVTLESLHEAIGQLVHAVQIIGQQQQWVTDRVAELGPLFAQLDHIFAGASSPVDILKSLMGMRKRVIEDDGTGE